MHIEDKIKAVFALPLGFLLGLVVAALAQLYAVGGAKMALILGGGLAVLFVGNLMMDRLRDWMMVSAAKRWGREDALEGVEAGRVRLPLYLFLVGAAAGLGAAAIWPIGQILGWMS